MTLRSDILDAQKEALKAHDEARLAVLRMLWSAIRNQEIEKGHTELKDDEVQKMAATQIKQLKDAAVDFARGDRQDLVAKSEAEIKILQAYLPEQMSDEELKSLVEKIIKEFGLSGTDVGKAMGSVMKEVKGRADGNRVKEVVSKILAG